MSGCSPLPQKEKSNQKCLTPTTFIFALTQTFDWILFSSLAVLNNRNISCYRWQLRKNISYAPYTKGDDINISIMSDYQKTTDTEPTTLSWLWRFCHCCPKWHVHGNISLPPALSDALLLTSYNSWWSFTINCIRLYHNKVINNRNVYELGGLVRWLAVEVTPTMWQGDGAFGAEEPMTGDQGMHGFMQQNATYMD